MTTPCETLGYKIDQVFKDKRDGELYVLSEDDGSPSPWFLSLKDSSLLERCCPPLSMVKRIYPPEELSQDVEVTCEGKTITISRKDAKTLNLCD